MYYLGSRYYDPQLHRFLNADNLVAETKNGIGYNLFVYSNNNPVNYKDEGGHTPDTVFDIIFICVDIVEVAANSANPVAWISLGADVVCLIVPVVSGGGAATRAIGTLDEGIDAIKTSYGKSRANYKSTADFMTNVECRNGKYYTDKVTIDEIGQIEARGEDFSI